MTDISAGHTQDRDHDRLTRGLGQVESETLELLGRLLPKAPATVLDAGAGTGVYARELLREGYTVHALDLMPGHVARLLSDPALWKLASVRLGNACDLPYPDGEADAVLLLGPLYHLTERSERLLALSEARRTLKPGGVVLAAGISRASAMAEYFAHEHTPQDDAWPLREAEYPGGAYREPQHRAGDFATVYLHHPDELEAELSAAGFTQVRVYAVEGPASLPGDPVSALNDPLRHEGVLSALRLLERDRALLGSSPHLLAVGVA